jgi:hypothetical protein
LMGFGEPKSIVMLAVVFASGCQVVALLPSMAASAYCPGTIVTFVPMVKDVSVRFTTVLHCARSISHRLSKVTKLSTCEVLLPGTRVPLVDLVGTTSDSPTFSELDERSKV